MRKTSAQLEQEAAFRSAVELAVSRARAASLAATAKFISDCNRTGHEPERAGMAVLWVYMPSYRLRAALKSLGAIDKYLDGYWSIDAVEVAKKGWGSELWEKGCTAALKVFEAAFPDDGTYSIHSWTN